MRTLHVFATKECDDYPWVKVFFRSLRETYECKAYEEVRLENEIYERILWWNEEIKRAGLEDMPSFYTKVIEGKWGEKIIQVICQETGNLLSLLILFNNAIDIRFGR